MVLRRADRLVVDWRDMRTKIMAKFGVLGSRNKGDKGDMTELVGEVKLCRT